MKTTIEAVFIEYDRIVEESPKPLASAPEGFALLEKEVEELWDEVKRSQNKNRMRKKALQVTAMAIRFIQDICDK